MGWGQKMQSGGNECKGTTSGPCKPIKYIDLMLKSPSIQCHSCTSHTFCSTLHSMTFIDAVTWQPHLATSLPSLGPSITFHSHSHTDLLAHTTSLSSYAHNPSQLSDLAIDHSHSSHTHNIVKFSPASASLCWKLGWTSDEENCTA